MPVVSANNLTTVTVVIPNHKEIAGGTLRAILKKAGWTSEHFVKLLSVIVALAVRYW